MQDLAAYSTIFSGWQEHDPGRYVGLTGTIGNQGPKRIKQNGALRRGPVHVQHSRRSELENPASGLNSTPISLGTIDEECTFETKGRDGEIENRSDGFGGSVPKRTLRFDPVFRESV